jgi:hypothetical protein
VLPREQHSLEAPGKCQRAEIDKGRPTIAAANIKSE